MQAQRAAEEGADLRIVIESVPGAPVVAVQAWIGSGGLDEGPEERGLAHLHEHMLFKGTPSRGVGEIAAAVERAGGQINAWTSNDQTCYHVVMPSHAWRQGLDVLADAVCHSSFDSEELTKEIEVVVEEIKRAADSPGQVAWRRMFEMAFAGHPYALPVLGTEDSVRSMNREKMLDFYRKHYVRGNTTVVVAGDVDAQEAREAVIQRFAQINPGPAPSKPPLDRDLPQARAIVEKTGFSESRLLMAWPAPTMEHPDVAALDVLAIVLGQGESSRLVQRVQRELGLANDAGASCWTPQHAGLFAVTVLTSAERIPAARAAALDVLQTIRREGIGEEELAKARRNVLAESVYKRETMEGLAHSLGFYMAALGDPHWDKDYERRIAAVTCADVLRVARQWLGPAHLQIAQLLGQDAEGLEEPEALLAAVQGALRDEPPVGGTPVRSRDLAHGIERLVLPSGDVLVVQVDRSVPLFGLRVATIGGLRAETVENNGRSRLLGEMLTRGTDRRDAHELASEIETLAAGLAGSAGRNSMGLQAVGLTSALPQVLDLFLDSLFHANLPEGDLEQVRALQLEELRHQNDAPARQAMRAMAQAVYGGHPYAMDMLGTPESVSALQRDDLLAYLRARLAPGKLVYAAAGDIDPDVLAEALMARTPVDRQGLTVPGLLAVEPPRERVQIHKTIEKQQAHLAIGFVGARLDQQDRFALDVLSTVLSGQSGRLFMELRDRQALAYSVSAMHVEGLDQGCFSLYIGTSPEKIAQATAGLWAEISKVRESRVDAEELDRAKQALAGEFAIGLQRRASRAATLCLNELYGLGRAAYRGQVEALLSITAEQLQDVAQRYLDPDHCVEVVLAP